MPHSYSALSHDRLGPEINLHQANELSVRRDSPATSMMTDLKHATAYSISAGANIGQANQKMILCGVRLLFVTDLDNRLTGLITTSDLFGERPLIYLQQHGGDRDSILVKDVMTPRDAIEAIDYGDVVRARVGDIMETLCQASRQHILVVDDNAIRGLFSATDIARSVGEDIPVNGRAGNFAELNSALIAH